MKRRWINISVICLLVALPISVKSAEMKTTPEVPVWVADGVTEYRLFVWVENTGLGGEPTVLVQWRLNNVPGFTYVNGSASAPGVNDFFAENPLHIDDFCPPGELSGLIVEPEEMEFGPVNSSGNLAEYRFTVPQGFTGIHTFTLTDTGMGGPSMEPQPHTISNDLITVAPPTQPDFNNDGYVNNDDYVIFESCLVGPDATTPTGCEEADLNDDGVVDLMDYASFQRCFTGDIPVSDPNCGN